MLANNIISRIIPLYSIFYQFSHCDIWTFPTWHYATPSTYIYKQLVTVTVRTLIRWTVLQHCSPWEGFRPWISSKIKTAAIFKLEQSLSALKKAAYPGNCLPFGIWRLFNDSVYIIIITVTLHLVTWHGSHREQGLKNTTGGGWMIYYQAQMRL